MEEPNAWSFRMGNIGRTAEPKTVLLERPRVLVVAANPPQGLIGSPAFCRRSDPEFVRAVEMGYSVFIRSNWRTRSIGRTPSAYLGDPNYGTTLQDMNGLWSIPLYGSPMFGSSLLWVRHASIT